MYRALYRKWRPMCFEDVVGQQAIVTALKNQIDTGRIGHAYLFTGTRGTGKTTCARIFAKAINCEHPDHGDPCGKCEFCQGIDNGTILDVEEIDAASNNGVDNIRDLRDETAYTPSMGRYKVYIIDEVHMLSTSAFNALLKILEEPPAHVVFILATTEIHKVLPTILSRCQRYDFGRITPEDIAGRVEYIAEEERIDLTPGAARLIARLADGALRDALSILDTCAGVAQHIDEEVVRRMAGVTDKSYLFRISQALAGKDTVTALSEVARLRQQSVDVKRLCEELINHYRNLMLAPLPGGLGLLSGIAPEDEALYQEQGKALGNQGAVHAISVLGEALEKMGRGTDQRIELELALFRLADPSWGTVAPMAAAAPQAFTPAAQPALAPYVPGGASVKPEKPKAAPVVVPTAPAVHQAEPPREETPVEPSKPSVRERLETPIIFEPWAKVVEALEKKDKCLYAFLKESKGYFNGTHVLFECPPFAREYLNTNQDSKKILKEIIFQQTGQRYGIGPYKAPGSGVDGQQTVKAVTADETLDRLRQLGLSVEED